MPQACRGQRPPNTRWSGPSRDGQLPGKYAGIRLPPEIGVARLSARRCRRWCRAIALLPAHGLTRPPASSAEDMGRPARRWWGGRGLTVPGPGRGRRRSVGHVGDRSDGRGRQSLREPLRESPAARAWIACGTGENRLRYVQEIALPWGNSYGVNQRYTWRYNPQAQEGPPLAWSGPTTCTYW
jgi:hypothetical protein